MGDIIKKNIGKNTLGDSNKMSVNLRTYDRSTHDLGYVWRNTQSPGTLVPFVCELGLPGDIIEMNLNADVMTHPTVGPLFGSFKLQLDVFTCPIRLYNAALHNNKLGVGLDMSKIKLPIITPILTTADNPTPKNPWSQINPSALPFYLGLKGYGTTTVNGKTATNNATAILAYYDIFKNYHANKQEPKFKVIAGGAPISQLAVDTFICNPININRRIDNNSNIQIIPYIPANKLNCLLKTPETNQTRTILLSALGNITGSQAQNFVNCEVQSVIGTNEILESITNIDEATLLSYDLTSIDDMREKILQAPMTLPVNINTLGSLFATLTGRDPSGKLNTTHPQFGLCLKTYNSDIYNNWINTEWLDGENGINSITAIDTSSGSFTMDTLNMQKKIYTMLNRIAVSGGTYQDWIETVFTNEYMERSETPVYHGGMSQEIVFQEVISNSATENEPLGTLAGRGKLSGNKKGGQVKIKIDEPSYVIGLVSITPRIDYNQGNRYDVNLSTLNDIHKPQLDGIGYQELLVDEMAWWAKKYETSTISRISVGKQPAWINYMTNFNKTCGNFAINDNEAFMVLNRNYELIEGQQAPKDLTTYIDPVKYNYIFADTSISAMNFWVQIGVDMKSRRKMSAKEIPNL